MLAIVAGSFIIFFSVQDEQIRFYMEQARDFNMRYEQVQVECYSGYKASERPIAFTCQERRREILEIVDRWYEGGIDPGRPRIDYFKVRTSDGQLVLLRHLSLFDAWSVRV